MVSKIKGSVQVFQEFSRSQAASQLQPPISSRTLQKYLEVAALFLPSFANFQDPQTGYLNRFARITNWHMPALQRIREYVRHHGMTQLQIKLAEQPKYFEVGETHDQRN